MVDQTSPIILIGAARSGTKFLRDVLAAPSGVKCVPYDVNYVWRYGNDKHPHDALTPDLLTEERIQTIRRTLFKLGKCGERDVLVEKTVSNSLRVAYVDRVFPNARYVHLIRDGRDVVESAMRQWQAKPDIRALLLKLRGIPFDSRNYVFWFAWNFITGAIKGRAGGNVWGPRYPGIDDLIDTAPLAEICALQWRESVQQAHIGLGSLLNSDSRVFQIRYEDLISDNTALAKLLEALRIPNAQAALRSYQSMRRPPPPQRWKTLAPSELETIGRIISDVPLDSLS